MWFGNSPSFLDTPVLFLLPNQLAAHMSPYDHFTQNWKGKTPFPSKLQFSNATLSKTYSLEYNLMIGTLRLDSYVYTCMYVVHIIFRRIMCVYVVFPCVSIYICTHVACLLLHFFPPTQFPGHLKKSSWPPKRDPPQGPTAPRPAQGGPA